MSRHATIESKWFFQFVFCAVSLAIVWGTTLERIKFGVYIIYAIVFSAMIYPIGAHWVFGGGFLADARFGMQDFAGSTAVHLIGATGAFAALLLLGPRRGKYGPDGKPRAIPGHNMPLFGLGVLILWLGWFGFNPGSTLQRARRPLPGDPDGHQPGAAAGVLAAVATEVAEDQDDRHRHGRQRRDRRARRDHGPVGLRRDVGGADHRRGRRRDRRRSASTRSTSSIDDPVGALSAHGLAGIWGTLSCGLFTAPRLAEYNAVGEGRPGLHGLVHAADRPGGRRRRRVRVRLRPLVRTFWSSRRHTACASPPRRRTPAWTSPSTACTATRSSSSRPRS